jgi:hypothetical protein
MIPCCESRAPRRLETHREEKEEVEEEVEEEEEEEVLRRSELSAR